MERRFFQRRRGKREPGFGESSLIGGEGAILAEQEGERPAFKERRIGRDRRGTGPVPWLYP